MNYTGKKLDTRLTHLLWFFIGAVIGSAIIVISFTIIIMLLREIVMVPNALQVFGIIVTFLLLIGLFILGYIGVKALTKQWLKKKPYKIVFYRSMLLFETIVFVYYLISFFVKLGQIQ